MKTYEQTPNKLHLLRTLHLFAGIGGGILADLLLGHQPVCAVEINSYCQQVLHARQKDNTLPWFPIFADVKEFDGKPWRGKVDVVCGGFPCQDISAARTNNHINGKQRGILGKSSGLWSEMRRIIKESQPGDVFAENSPQLRTRGLSVILRDLASMGYDARWGVFSVRGFGANHIRERLFILASNPNLSQRKRGGLSSGIYQEYSNAICSDWRKDKPEMERVEDGTPHRLDRLRGIGNSQAPICAVTAWMILSEGLE